MVKKLQKEIIKFVNERNWKQFHTHKNLAIGISVESNELLENFMWDHENYDDLSEERKENVKEELADIMIYLLEFYHSIDLDLEKAVKEKLKNNEEKYPVEKAKGSSLKYNEL